MPPTPTLTLPEAEVISQLPGLAGLLDAVWPTKPLPPEVAVMSREIWPW